MFPTILKIAAVICAVACFIAAVKLGEEYNGYWHERNATTTFLWCVGGIVNGIAWWALSYVVEACQRYIKNNER